MRRSAALAALLAAAPVTLSGQQHADTAFHPTVARPAHSVGTGPRVAVDEAHENFHTVAGRYAPFAALLRADGFRVAASRVHLDSAALAGCDVLVIANAGSVDAGGATTDRSAFAPDEIEALHAWVARGGALLLIADHAPFGGAAAALAQRFGVGMTKGFAFDTARAAHFADDATFLRYTRENHGLADHPITRGRDASERIATVVAFTGQSLTPPPGAAPLLVMSPTAQERAGRDPRVASVAVGGKVQGLALAVGRGRVVVLGEAAMLSAQIIDRPGQPPFSMGMNVPGTDDRQFALNVVRWLGGVL